VAAIPARLENAGGTISIAIDFDVKPGMILVQGTAPQDIPHRRHIEHEMPAGFGNGTPVEIPSPPGSVTVMVKRVIGWRPRMFRYHLLNVTTVIGDMSETPGVEIAVPNNSRTDKLPRCNHPRQQSALGTALTLLCSQAGHQRRGAADCGEHRQAAEP
jgi:hypothetical protein